MSWNYVRLSARVAAGARAVPSPSSTIDISFFSRSPPLHFPLSAAPTPDGVSSAQLLASINSAQRRYDLLIFPDERHLPRGEEDRTYLEARLVEFFDRTLR